jgi:hypothetical protein
LAAAGGAEDRTSTPIDHTPIDHHEEHTMAEPAVPTTDEAEREERIEALQGSIAELRTKVEDLRVQAHLAGLDGLDAWKRAVDKADVVERRADEVMVELGQEAGTLARSLVERSKEIVKDIEAAIGGLIIAARRDDD